MFKKRIKQFKLQMDKKEIKLAFITSPINVFYFTGFYCDPMERFYGLVISLKDDEPTLLLPELELQAALKEKLDCRLVPISDLDNPYDKLQEVIKDSISLLGLETKKETIYSLEQFKRNFTAFEYVSIDSYIMELRVNKTSDEIQNVKKAISITSQALEKLFESSVIGKTELMLSSELQTSIRDLGGERPGSPLVLSGKRSALPHGIPSNKKIEKGDFLLIDFGVIINGYTSDVTRTYVVGEATEKQVDMYEAVLEANEKAIAHIEVGQTLSEIDFVARNCLADANYDEYFIHRTGHGLGLEIHEEPFIYDKNKEKLEEGMLFTIEPGIYIPDIGGVRIEDNVYMASNGDVHVLSTISKELTFVD